MNNQFKYKLMSFQQLSAAQLYELLQLRSTIFVVEQKCAYQDIDGTDLTCTHLLVNNASTGELIAYCRIIMPSTEKSSDSNAAATFKIGRVLVKKNFRKKGLATTLMQTAINYCQNCKSQSSTSKVTKITIDISAQTYLTGFYESLGFFITSDSYDEDGIEHIDMRYIPD